MALESCGTGCGCRACHGFAALPAPLVAAARGAASGGARGAAQAAAAYGAGKAWQKLGVPGPMPTSAAGVARAGIQYGTQKAQGFLQEKTGLPIPIPTEFSAKGIAQAGYDAVRVRGEQAIQSALGVPIQLPKKLTAKEIGRAIGAVFPTDVEGALDLALSAGAQAGAAAVTSLLVGAGVGSVIPGLGTIVGIGAALGVQALKSLIQSFRPQTHPCKLEGACPVIPPRLNAFQAIKFIDGVPSQFPQVRKVFGRKCTGGTGDECLLWLEKTRERVVRVSLGTAPKMGLLEVQAALADLSSNAPWTWVAPAWRTSTDGARLLNELGARQAELQAYLVNAARGQVGRFQAVAEFHKAAVAYEVAQNPATQGWLKTTYEVLDRVLKADAARLQVQQVEQARRTAYGQQQTRVDPKAAEIATARAGCITGHRPSCEKLRQLQGGMSAPKTPALDPARVFCQALLDDWLKKNPVQARCLGPLEKARILDLCYQAHGLKKMTLAQSLQQIFQVIQAACNRSKTRPAVVPSARYV